MLRLAVTNASNWPEDRVEVPANSNRSFVSAVFVTYHSVLQPLSNLGNVGDLWLTPNVLFWKEHKDRWRRWTPLSVYRCPFDPTRRTRLVFSHMAEFKYVGTETENSEYIKWKSEDGHLALAHDSTYADLCIDLGVPESCIPTFLRERIPGATAAINKNRYDLQEIDIVFLYNIRLDFIRLGYAMCILAPRQGEAVAMGQNTITQGHVQQTCISPRVREDGAGQRAHPHEEAVESITSHDQLQLQEAEQDMDQPRLDDSDEEVDLLLDEGRDSIRPLALPSTQSRELPLQLRESSRFGEHEDTEVRQDSIRRRAAAHTHYCPVFLTYIGRLHSKGDGSTTQGAHIGHPSSRGDHGRTYRGRRPGVVGSQHVGTAHSGSCCKRYIVEAGSWSDENDIGVLMCV